MPELKQLTIEELYHHIEQVGGTAIRGSNKAANVQDPLVPLDKPLAAYQDRVFFYVGLLYGFCRLDGSLTERFREDSGQDLDTQLHLVDKPIMAVRGFPDFAKTRVSRLLQSCPVGKQADLFDYIACQVVVDRARARVWKIAMTTCRIPDPVVGQQHFAGHQLVVFYPQTCSFEYKPVESAGMLLSAPEVQYFERSDPAFKSDTEKHLERKV